MNHNIIVINIDDDNDDIATTTTTSTTTTNHLTDNSRSRNNGSNRISNPIAHSSRAVHSVPKTPVDKNTKRAFLADVHQRRITRISEQSIKSEVVYNNHNNIVTNNNNTSTTTTTSKSSNNIPIEINDVDEDESIIQKQKPIQQNGKGYDLDQYRRLRDQMQSIRKNKHQSYRNDKLSTKKLYTMSDIDTMSKYEEESKMYFESTDNRDTDRRGKVNTINNTFRDPESIGRKALELSNEFRKKNNRPPCQWHKALFAIGVEHCKNMSEKKVPFGHEGFHDRVKRFPFNHRKSGENVAMNNCDATVAETAVEGWINSKGHRENLLDDFNICTIGVYQGSDGMWYLTQLFAKV